MGSCMLYMWFDNITDLLNRLPSIVFQNYTIRPKSCEHFRIP